MDTHIHTKYSFDADCELSEILEKTNQSVTFTDSIVFNNTQCGEDTLLDYDAYTQEILSLREKFEQPIYKGVEIGYTDGNQQKINQYLLGKEFDCKLLTIMGDGQKDFMDDEVAFSNVKHEIEHYFEVMKKAIEGTPDINVLSTFDYGFRRFTLSERTSHIIVRPLVEEIFKFMVKKDIALEINSKSCYFFGYQHHYEKAIPLYLSLGGSLFTLGSDAKSPEQIEMNFSRSLQILRQNNVGEIVEFKNGQPVATTIENLV